MTQHTHQAGHPASDPGTMELSPAFLEIAACPACHGKFAVDYDSHELVCSSTSCGLAYPVRDGIPVLLVDEARHPTR